MRTVRTVPDVRAALRDARRAGRRIGLVPTMGALHGGHAALVDAARARCDVAVVSLFVNPRQFDEAADLAAYPRDEAADAALLEAHGADLLWAPSPQDVYPPGFAAEVRVSGPVTEALEGAHRGPAHFHGVTTVVTKLFNVVQPDVAFFGQKDAQQVVVIRTLVRDLDLPVEIAVVPTVREDDGLALSSRNARLDPGERRRALGLSAALRAAEAAHAAGERDAAAVRARAVAALEDFAPVELEYLELVDPSTLDPVPVIDGQVLVAVAARVGSTRLIDNTIITGRQ